MQLVVDIEVARAELARRGVDVSKTPTSVGRLAVFFDPDATPGSCRDHRTNCACFGGDRVGSSPDAWLERMNS